MPAKYEALFTGRRVPNARCAVAIGRDDSGTVGAEGSQSGARNVQGYAPDGRLVWRYNEALFARGGVPDACGSVSAAGEDS